MHYIYRKDRATLRNRGRCKKLLLLSYECFNGWETISRVFCHEVRRWGMMSFNGIWNWKRNGFIAPCVLSLPSPHLECLTVLELGTEILHVYTCASKYIQQISHSRVSISCEKILGISSFPPWSIQQEGNEEMPNTSSHEMDTLECDICFIYDESQVYTWKI